MKRFLTPFFALFLLTAGKLPEITPLDVSTMLAQIMESHASYKVLTPALVARAVESYLEEIDGSRCYLLKSEVDQWLELDDYTPLLEQVNNGDFSFFQRIQDKMLFAIHRRNRLEAKIDILPPPEEVSIDEFHDLPWAESEEVLLDRLHKLRTLQLEAAEKLDIEARDRVMQRIVKRRLVKEDEVKSASTEEMQKIVLSNVLKSFACSLDGHTSYFTPGEASQFMIQVQQRLFGIGAQLRDDLNGFTIVKIIEGGPASQDTGLKVGDRVIAIDDEPVVGYEITDAVELIRGEEGTQVVLTALRDEEVHKIVITRGEVVIQEARIESHTYPYGDGVIAHIALHAFYQDPVHSSCSDIYEHLAEIKKNDRLKGVVLDLRTNSGGVLPQAVAVCGLFISKGIVVSVKDNNGELEHLRDIDGKVAYDGPLIVLTSKISASAAEIVAQTLQDYGRAIVVGDEHTYGKGTFQTFTLDAASNGRVNPKGEFKVTRGRYYTVSGKSPQLVGVASDIVVPSAYSVMDIGEKYGKFPLENDSIPENFDDDLSDIPLVQREQISWLYRYNLQPRLKMYNRFIPLLAENSKKRVEQSKLYQNFLAALDEDDVPSERIELLNKSDPQLQEAIDITKDLILLLN
ncbi:MAG: PDZ domain-containing protein [Chlamydiales bacterium]|nr:PDZ domain-containing protein [Chlamydiales bacterium]